MVSKILEFSNQIVNFLGIKVYLKPIYHKLYKSKIEEKQRIIFHNYGREALKVFDECLQEANIPYCLAFGTLLGAVREKGFIKHDLDIDVMMWSENYKDELPNILASKGIIRKHTFLVDGGLLGREESYEFKGVQIDIFFLYSPKHEMTYCCDFLQRDCLTFEECIRKHGSLLPRKLELPVSKNLRKVPFEDLMLPIPENAYELMEFRYGPDFMIPNSNWNVQSYNKHIIEWPEKEGEYYSFE